MIFNELNFLTFLNDINLYIWSIIKETTMGLRIIKDAENNYSVMYCSTSMECFGPVFYEDEDIQDFLDWYGKEDPRSLTQSELTNKVNEWRYLVEPEPKLKNDFLGLSELFNNINIRP